VGGTLPIKKARPVRPEHLCARRSKRQQKHPWQVSWLREFRKTGNSHHSGATARGFHPFPYSPRTCEAPRRFTFQRTMIPSDCGRTLSCWRGRCQTNVRQSGPTNVSLSRWERGRLTTMVVLTLPSGSSSSKIGSIRKKRLDVWLNKK
jgi:hypothetical protein